MCSDHNFLSSNPFQDGSCLAQRIATHSMWPFAAFYVGVGGWNPGSPAHISGTLLTHNYHMGSFSARNIDMNSLFLNASLLVAFCVYVYKVCMWVCAWVCVCVCKVWEQLPSISPLLPPWVPGTQLGLSGLSGKHFCPLCPLCICVFYEEEDKLWGFAETFLLQNIKLL